MDAPLDEQYLSWIYEKVASVKLTSRSRTYWSLFRFLYTREFVWLVPNDDNRVEDGRELRYEFLDDAGITHVDKRWMDLGCSVLEMIFAVSRIAAFEDDRDPKQWFWEIIKNLGLERQTDIRFNESYTGDVVETLIWRNYEPSGRGGMFPLQGRGYPDQREVEIWYQLSAYLLERE